jgi:hypothetical protein
MESFIFLCKCLYFYFLILCMQPITDYPNKFSSLFSNVVFDVPFFLAGIGATFDASTMLLLSSLVNILLCSMMPRFIVSVRELYDRDPSRRQGIDTGFGVLSQLDGQNAAMSAIAFADVTPGQDRAIEDGNDSEAIRLGAVGGGAGQV